MHTCSNCGKACIPVWRALINTSFSAPIFCRCCNARLVRKRRAVDIVVGVPMIIAVAAAQYWEIKSAGFTWFFFGYATLSGIVLWLHFVVYEKVDDRTISFLGKGKGRRFAKHD